MDAQLLCIYVNTICVTLHNIFNSEPDMTSNDTNLNLLVLYHNTYFQTK